MIDASRLAYYLAVYMKGERLIREYKFAKKKQYDTLEGIQEYQIKEFKRLYRYAYENIPFYNRLYKKHGLAFDEEISFEFISRLPTIQKKDIIHNQNLMINDSSIGLFATRKTTGGSTGEPVTIYKNPRALAAERAVTWVGYEWAGISIADRHVRIWGDPIDVKQTFKRRIIDLFANRLRLSAFALSDKQFNDYYKKVSNFKPVYLYGYVSALLSFSEYIFKNNLALPKTVKAVIATSEVLTPWIKSEMEKNFGVRVYNEYGCGEVGSIAHECERGGLHLMETNVFVEVDAEDGAEGELIVTDLTNYLMPLIRYRIGDYGAIDSSMCQCGRMLKKLSNIHGRAYDCLVRSNGEKVHPEAVMYILEMVKAKYGALIDKFKVIQKSLDILDVLLIVPHGQLEFEVEEVIKNELIKKLPDLKHINFKYVNKIGREKSGKMRVVVSEVGSSQNTISLSG